MAQTSSAGRGAGAPPERSAVQKAAAEEEPREGLRVQAEGRRECSWVPRRCDNAEYVADHRLPGVKQVPCRAGSDVLEPSPNRILTVTRRRRSTSSAPMSMTAVAPAPITAACAAVAGGSRWRQSSRSTTLRLWALAAAANRAS